MEITQISFLKYRSLKDRIWAFGMMQFAHKYLSNADGLSTYKLMGSGKKLGFDPRPDWSTYVLLMVWQDERSAADFWNSNPLATKYRRVASAIWTIDLLPIKSHGEWKGKNIFRVNNTSAEPGNKRIAVLTRASIKPKKLIRFWRNVPSAQKRIFTVPGLEYTKGIGEVPLLNMATFSIWESIDAVNDFAYGSDGHKNAIKLTKKLNWYSEELFARFEILHESGDSLPFLEQFERYRRPEASITPNDH